MCRWFFVFQAEDGIRDLGRSRGLGDVYKRQPEEMPRVIVDGRVVGTDGVAIARARIGTGDALSLRIEKPEQRPRSINQWPQVMREICLLYTSDAADERSSVDLGGRRILKKKHMFSASLSDLQTITSYFVAGSSARCHSFTKLSYNTVPYKPRVDTFFEM